MIRILKLITDKEKNDLINAISNSNNMRLNQEELKRLIQDLVNAYNPNNDHIYVSYTKGVIDGFIFARTKEIIPTEDNFYTKITKRIDDEVAKIGVEADAFITIFSCFDREDCTTCNKLLDAIEYDFVRSNTKRLCFYTSNPAWLSFANDCGFELINTIEVNLKDILKGYKDEINIRVFTKNIH